MFILASLKPIVKKVMFNMDKTVLDKQRVREVLVAGDKEWSTHHSGQFKYQEHLDFLAHYIVKHYSNKKNSVKAGGRS